jgi:adenylate cyclase
MKKVFILLFINLYAVNLYAQKQGQARLDSLLESLNAGLSKNKEWADTSKVSLLIELAYEYHKTDPNKGLKIAEEALQLSEKLNWKNGIASACNRMGLCYWAKAEYPKALEWQFKALPIFEETQNKKGIATVLGNIGLVYDGQQDYEKALEYHFKALKLNNEMSDSSGVARNMGNIGMAYDAQADFKNSLDYYIKALNMYEAMNDKNGMARNLGNIGFVYNEQGNHIKALEFHFKALHMNLELGNKILTALNYGNIGEEYFNIANDTSSRWRKVSPDSLNKINALQKGEDYLKKGIEMFREIGDYNSLQELYQYLSDLYWLKGNYKLSLESFREYATAKDSIFNADNRRKINRLESKRVEEMHKKEIELKDLTISKARNEKRILFTGIFLSLCIAIVIYRQRTRISREKERSEKLLLNILPSEVAEELKEKGSAEAKQFEKVTVMFTDFKGFTQISEKLSPAELVAEIHTCFKAFDNIITKHNIEKIKTIGDSYMCAGGLPVANKTNATDVVKAALEIQQFMQQHLHQRKNEGKEIFEIRIGIHTGPVVAGIVGVKKFAYDIWGDTVNIASRMESSGEAGKVNISGSTYQLVKDLPAGQAGKFNCIHRGKIQAKNKGEIDMYFVETKN